MEMQLLGSAQVWTLAYVAHYMNMNRRLKFLRGEKRKRDHWKGKRNRKKKSKTKREGYLSIYD